MDVATGSERTELFLVELTDMEEAELANPIGRYFCLRLSLQLYVHIDIYSAIWCFRNLTTSARTLRFVQASPVSVFAAAGGVRRVRRARTYALVEEERETKNGAHLAVGYMTKEEHLNVRI